MRGVRHRGCIITHHLETALADKLCEELESTIQAVRELDPALGLQHRSFAAAGKEIVGVSAIGWICIFPSVRSEAGALP